MDNSALLKRLQEYATDWRTRASSNTVVLEAIAALSPSEDMVARDVLRTCLYRDRKINADKAREFASHYPQGSDGRNTFIILAEWIESRIPPNILSTLKPEGEQISGEAVDRAARALCIEAGALPDTPTPYNPNADFIWHFYRESARVALEAALEPKQ